MACPYSSASCWICECSQTLSSMSRIIALLMLSPHLFLLSLSQLV